MVESAEKEENVVKAQVLGITAAKMGITAVPVVLAPNNPFFALVGTVAAEAFQVAVSQRIQNRKNKVRSSVQEKLHNLEGDERAKFINRLNNNQEAYSNLLEKGVEQSAKALSEARLESIASIIATGVTSNLGATQASMCLDFIDRMDDCEFLIFHSMCVAFDSGPYRFTEDDIRRLSTGINNTEPLNDDSNNLISIHMLDYAMFRLQNNGLVCTLRKTDKHYVMSELGIIVFIHLFPDNDHFSGDVSRKLQEYEKFLELEEGIEWKTRAGG